MVCGLANNQLAEPRHGDALRQRGILYAPDYVVNAGGMLYASEDIFGSNDQARSIERIHGIEDILLNIYRRAEDEAASTHAIANLMAEEKMGLATHGGH